MNEPEVESGGGELDFWFTLTFLLPLRLSSEEEEEEENEVNCTSPPLSSSPLYYYYYGLEPHMRGGAP